MSWSNGPLPAQTHALTAIYASGPNSDTEARFRSHSIARVCTHQGGSPRAGALHNLPLSVNCHLILQCIDFITEDWDGWDSNPGPKP
jgi:hypothetical protein